MNATQSRVPTLTAFSLFLYFVNEISSAFEMLDCVNKQYENITLRSGKMLLFQCFLMYCRLCIVDIID